MRVHVRYAWFYPLAGAGLHHLYRRPNERTTLRVPTWVGAVLITYGIRRQNHALRLLEFAVEHQLEDALDAAAAVAPEHALRMLREFQQHFQGDTDGTNHE